MAPISFKESRCITLICWARAVAAPKNSRSTTNPTEFSVRGVRGDPSAQSSYRIDFSQHLSQLPKSRVHEELRGTVMRTSTLAITVTAAFLCPQMYLQAGEYFQSNMAVTLASDNGTNLPAGHRDYLLSYQDETGPKKYLDWLWKDPVNLLTRPAFWDGTQWRTFGIEAGITGALFPLG